MGSVTPLYQNNLRKDVWLVIPAYNEDQVISDVLDGLAPLGYSLVVIDDGSKDSTYEKACGHSAHVCRHAINLGQGASIQTGISYALKHGASYIITFDADGQHSTNDIPAFISVLESGKFEIALGSRFVAGGKAENIPPAKRALLYLATLFTRVTSGLNISDTHNGFRGFTRNAAMQLRITQNRMAHGSQILSEIARTGLPYTEVPVHIHYTEYSMAKGQKMSNSFNILWESLTGKLRR
jgi:glycosyltransferase involved in cell wall biosynthesis